MLYLLDTEWWLCLSVVKYGLAHSLKITWELLKIQIIRTHLRPLGEGPNTLL